MEPAFTEQAFNAELDLVAYGTNSWDVFAARIRDWPIEALKAGDMWPVFAATDGDQCVGQVYKFVSELLRRNTGEVQSFLAHNTDDFGMDMRCRVGSGRESVG